MDGNPFAANPMGATSTSAPVGGNPFDPLGSTAATPAGQQHYPSTSGGSYLHSPQPYGSPPSGSNLIPGTIQSQQNPLQQQQIQQQQVQISYSTELDSRQQLQSTAQPHPYSPQNYGLSSMSAPHQQQQQPSLENQYLQQENQYGPSSVGAYDPFAATASLKPEIYGNAGSTGQQQQQALPFGGYSSPSPVPVMPSVQANGYVQQSLVLSQQQTGSPWGLSQNFTMSGTPSSSIPSMGGAPLGFDPMASQVSQQPLSPSSAYGQQDPWSSHQNHQLSQNHTLNNAAHMQPWEFGKNFQTESPAPGLPWASNDGSLVPVAPGESFAPAEPSPHVPLQPSTFNEENSKEDLQIVVTSRQENVNQTSQALTTTGSPRSYASELPSSSDTENRIVPVSKPGVESRNKYSTALARQAPPDASPLPKAELVRKSGYVLSRISFRTIVMKKWKQSFWVQYGSHTMLWFRSQADFDDWLNNPYHTQAQRNFLIKLAVNFVHDLYKPNVRGYQVTQCRTKPYGNKMVRQFKLERWMDYGPTIAAAFGSYDPKEVDALREAIVECMRNTPLDGGIRATGSVRQRGDQQGQGNDHERGTT